MAKNIVAAIVDRAMATPAIAAILAGGITHGRAPDSTPTPYGSLHHIGGSDHLNTGTAYYRETTYQLSLFAPSLDTLDTLTTLLNRAFNLKMVPLVFDDGSHVLVLAGQLHYVGESLDRDGSPLHHGYVEITTRHNRSFA